MGNLVSGCAFRNERVVLHGAAYVGCTFHQCELGRVNTNHVDDQGEVDEGGEHQIELLEA
jgi:hypothetical protein